MDLLTLGFLLFCIALVIIYYLVPKTMQWWVLLAASLYFYAMSGIKNILYVLITALSTYVATRMIQSLTDRQKEWIKANKKTTSKEERAAYKAHIQAKRRAILVAALLLNFGILCTFKYLHFLIAQVNTVISSFGASPINDTLKLIIPLGISFYTFQTMGYLVDVYWNKYPAEKNFGRVLLFVSFFPQMTQGPISNYKDLTTELFKEHTFTYHHFSWGAQRMFWGFFKKMVVANVLSAYVQDVFANYASYSGITTLIGAFMYSVQIYADFSGYMDMMCGFCEVLDIRLTENFERPYFSKSIAEYWRRWHSSLGAWFKTYIYYPMAMVKWNQKLGRWAKQKLGKTFGQTVPASVALVVVWLTTGLWHGASWAYIAWGGVNGIFIIVSLWMETVYASWKQKLGINEASWGWRAFQTIRTFILVTFIKVLPEVGTLSDGFGLWKQIFTNHTIPRSFHALLPFVDKKMPLLAVMIGTILIFVTSLIQRRQPIRQWLEDHTNYAVRVLIFAVLFIVIVYFGYPASGNGGGFMYEQF